MINLDKYPDNTILRSSEIAAWLEMPVASVLSMGIKWLPRRKRQYEALAGEVKRSYLGERVNRPVKASGFRLASGGR
jgi:hypothetical protein